MLQIIRDLAVQKLAVQLPDSQLKNASAICLQFQCPTYVLGDTTFGNCCIDTVAAGHIQPDLLIHYGHACLSMHSCEYPVYYVFDKFELDLGRVYEQLLGVEGNVLVYYDVGYHHAMHALEEMCPARITFTKIDVLVMPKQASHHKFSGRYYSLPKGVTLQDVTVFYIGPSSLFASNLYMKYLNNKVVSYDPSVDKLIDASANRTLMRRYALVQKAKDANVIGIVVGTLGVESYLPIIEKLKTLVLTCGKKPYMLAVGKPNPAKLGNFLEIDVFCHVSCAENSMLDSKEYLKPIVMPHELMLALDTELGWDASKYELDLNRLESELDARIKDVSEREESENDEARFSLATGKIVQNKKLVQRVHRVIEIEEQALAKRFEGTVFVQQSPAAEYLSQRTFKGLDPTAPSEASRVVNGRRGIARGYQPVSSILRGEEGEAEDKTVGKLLTDKQ